MKYIARVEARHETPAGAEGVGADNLESQSIVELTGVEHGVVGSTPRRWIGVLIGVAATVTGLGFVGHGSGPPIRAAAGGGSVTAAAAAATPPGLIRADESGATALGGGDEPVIVIAPADGAAVTSGVAMTGGVVMVDAIARRALGTVHASVSMGELVLGSTDIEAQNPGPFEFRIPVFPPPFAAPVVLQMHAAPSVLGGGFDGFRDFYLKIPYRSRVLGRVAGGPNR